MQRLRDILREGVFLLLTTFSRSQNKVKVQ